MMYCRRFSLPWARSVGLQRQTTLSARYWSSSSSKEQRYKYRYEPSAVESKWQAEWKRQANSSTKEIDNSLRLAEAPAATNKGEGRGGGESSVNGGKYYMLSMFPYPSGRLHMGHVRVYTISDTLAHFHRMQGKSVLHPMGWDAFGLPAENAAIEKGTTPAEWTKDNISAMRNQLNRLGCQFDWNREVTTCSPDYYKWTQWLFLKLYEHGLAYKKQALVNWDPVDQTVLANEQVDSDGCSWRSGAKVEQKMLNQWFFKITHYAEALLEGLKELYWPEKVKTMQEHWIGKSEGAYFDFPIAQEEASGQMIRVFTTKVDTLFGVSFLALSPEHELLQSRQELFTETVLRAVDEMKNNQSINSSSVVDANNRPKNGIAVGLHATHPLTGAQVPVYVADYIIGEYGTKAVMGVPAHDDRDLLFANEHGLPVVKVIEVPEAKKGTGGSEGREEREREEENGVLVNSGQFTGMSVEQGRREITCYAEREGFGGHMTQYKLRDWLISRQRYWGAPIPVLYCDKCGEVPVYERDLPVLLPEDIEFTGRGPSPLARAERWLRASCGKPDCCAVRETDTIDTFVDSSWYFLRYINPNNTERPFVSEDANLWMPVDTYVGGIEHAVLHLLYARFITHFLHDVGLVRHKEPFKKLLTQGMVQGKTHRLKESGRYLKPEEIESNQFSEDQVDVSWEKMSKSKYNGVEPEDIINKFGADTVRLFMLFRAPPAIDIQWDMTAIITFERWQKRLWDLVQIHRSVCEEEGVKAVAEVDSRKLRSAMHRAIKQVTEALEEQNTFNVAVAELMAFSNHIRDSTHLVGSCDYHMALCTLCTLLAPMAPHIASEMWVELREAARQIQITSPEVDVLEQPWPQWSEEEIREGTSGTQVMICVNGKKKGTISVPVEWTFPEGHSQLEAEAVTRARDEQLIGSHVTVTKVIVAAHGNLVNLVTRS